MTPVQMLQSGGILLYPTDTLYALGVDALNPEAIKKLKALKGRDDKKPISVIVADMAMAEEYVEVTPLARALAARFLPGKLTVVLAVLRKLPYGNFLSTRLSSGSVNLHDLGYVLPEELTAGTGTVGIRIPRHVFCTNLAREFGRPITATSANAADEESKNSVPEILAEFGERAAMIEKVIDAGELAESLPSTVVDARGEKPVILREGAIPAKDIREV